MPNAPSPRVLAVIPARGGSKGLPRKNITELAGLPLIGHSLAAAAMMPWITRCVVSTDDDEIAAVATELGARPAVPQARSLGRRRHADGTGADPCARGGDKPTGKLRTTTCCCSTRRARFEIPTTAAEHFDLLRERPDLDGVISVSAPEFHPVWVGVRGRRRAAP